MKTIKNINNATKANSITKAYIMSAGLRIVLGIGLGFGTLSAQGKLDVIDNTNSISTVAAVKNKEIIGETNIDELKLPETTMDTLSEESQNKAQIFIQDLSQFDSLLNASTEQIHSYLLELHTAGKLKNELALWSTDPMIFISQPTLTLGFLIDINATLDNRFEFQFSEKTISETLSLINNLRISMKQTELPLYNMNNFVGTAASLHTIQNTVQFMLSDMSADINIEQTVQDLISLYSLLQTLDISEINTTRTQSEEASLFILSHPKSTSDTADYSQQFYNQLVKFANTGKFANTDTPSAAQLEELYKQTSHSILMQELAIISYQVGKELGTSIDISKKAKEYKAKQITTEEQFHQAKQNMQMVQEGMNLIKYWMENIS